MPIYLDHNATTPIDPAVIEAMEPYLREYFGNPSSIEHEHGHVAAVAVDRAREHVANAIGARPREIVFTGSCTEADNLAVLGVARANSEKRHIVTTKIEHPAVLESARALEREGWRVTYVGVNEAGLVSVDEIADALTNETVLVSVMAANNEVGTLQPIAEIGALCSSRGILFHSDLAQIMATGSVNVERDNIHLASLSAHKAYGPKGIGALYIRSRHPRAKLLPVIFGGGQERGLRSGTLNTPAIVGMGEAMRLAQSRSKADSVRLRCMCEEFKSSFMASVSGTHLNGDPEKRIANNLSFSIDNVEPLALMRVVREYVSFSASSACATDKMTTSHVLLAMFGDTARARTAFRIAPGRFTSESDFESALSHLIKGVLSLQNAVRPAS
jgi:cysteine desulfurase